MTKAVVPLLLVLVFATPALAQAPASQAPAEAEVDVEVRDLDKGRDEITRFRLAVPASGATATLHSSMTDVRYELKLRQDRPGTGSYALELQRHAVSRVTRLDLHVDSARVLTAGQREVIGAVDRPDGSRTEVALTLRK
jgi:hypothetical protein